MSDISLLNEAALFEIRNLDDACAEADRIVTEVIAEHKPKAVYLLLSGGDDSMVLLDVMAHRADAILHVNTGFGIPATNEFVREECARRGLTLHELMPPESFEELVLGRWDGFPGDHKIAYGQLKRKAIERFLNKKTDPGKRIVLLTGLRKAESKNREYNYTPVERRGGEVWTNPLFFWTNEEMHAYRRDRNLPRNPVSTEMHMSGECLCGSRAHPGEREEWAYWHPEFIARVEALEAECQRLGKTYCVWGQRPPKQPRKQAEGQGRFMPMCVGCDDRFEVPA